MFINKNLFKYIHVESYFEGFIIRNSVVQSKFNFDVPFSSYDFFNCACVEQRGRPSSAGGNAGAACAGGNRRGVSRRETIGAALASDGA